MVVGLPLATRAFAWILGDCWCGIVRSTQRRGALIGAGEGHIEISKRKCNAPRFRWRQDGVLATHCHDFKPEER